MGACLTVEANSSLNDDEFILPPSLQNDKSTLHEQMLEVLEHPQLVILFQKYLKSTLSHEPLYFYMDVEEYRTIQDPSARRAKAHQIHSKYFSSDSCYEISASSQDVLRIQNQLTESPQDLFREVQREVLVGLTDDCLPNFLKWELYGSFVKDPAIRKIFLCGIRRTQSINQLLKYAQKPGD
eukprot:TRINITY_DN12808_c0_g1_i1.p1 TRINITY_DN12808_c0_g1~~TRINITY_DN12808_c0_g1_i1.p1  ORF type:complete len:182 (-),score=32.10 TRINITY_DN12808_c0_g1_i1:126-671(-)